MDSNHCLALLLIKASNTPSKVFQGTKVFGVRNAHLLLYRYFTNAFLLVPSLCHFSTPQSKKTTLFFIFFVLKKRLINHPTKCRRIMRYWYQYYFRRYIRSHRLSQSLCCLISTDKVFRILDFCEYTNYP